MNLNPFMLVGVIIFIVLFFSLALKRLDWALLLLVAALPTYLIRFHFFGLPLTLLEAMILIAFTVWFFGRFRPELKKIRGNLTGRIPYPYYREIILLLIISLAAAGVAGFSANALGIWKAYFFEPLLLFIMIFNVFKDKRDQKKILWALLVSAAAVSLCALFQKVTGLFIANPFWADAANRRVVSFFGYPNAVGLYLAPLIALFLGWFLAESGAAKQKGVFKKLAIAVVIALSLLAIYFARSEGALIGLAAGLILFGLLAGKKPRIATVILLALAVGGLLFSAPLKNYFVNKITLRDLSGEIRKQQWKETISLLTGTKIITGAGLDNYQAAVKPYHHKGIFFNRDNMPNFDSQLYGSSTLRAIYWQPVEIYKYPHNIFLNFWSELGLFGALLFVWIIFKYLYGSLKLTVAFGRENNPEKYLALGLLIAMIVIVVHGLVDVPYFKNDLAAMFWLLIALTAALDLSYRRANLQL